MRHPSETNLEASFDAPFDEEEDLLRRIDALARLLDARFSIFGVRFGIDGLVGLIPGIGDVATAMMSFYLILLAARAGAGIGVILAMVFNVLIDTLVGSIPVLGDIFDVTYRANIRNAELLREYLAKKKARRERRANHG